MKLLPRNAIAPFMRMLTLFVLAFLVSITAHAQDTYQQRNLVSDGAIPAANTDPNLVNSWGIAVNPFGPVWVADNGTGVATVYDGMGTPKPIVVQIPAAANATGPGKPTGIVFNGSPDFVISKSGTSAPSRFIFATEDGVIAAWASTVDPSNAIRVVDNSATHAIYKGLALSAGGTGGLLYATDFHNNKIDVFDSSFKNVTPAGGAFSDPTIPAGFAPFGIQAINGDIYVSYAKQDEQKQDDVPGPGLGYVNVFKPNGKLIRRVASQGALNAPWGMTLAPAGFGKFSNRLLIGNFGDGVINAYDAASGDFVGALMRENGQTVVIDGLWGLAFGNGYENQPVNTLFFAAGPNDEQHGLFGRIDVTGQNGSDMSDGY